MATAKAILETLRVLQAEDIALSKATIRRGAVERGEGVKRPRLHGEWNGRRDVEEAEKERRYRALHPEAR
jgi:hypothetical protein